MNLIKKQSSLFPLFFDQFFKNNWDINVPQNSFYNPSFNVKENDKEYVLEVIAPGKSNEDFQIEIENRLLSISTLNKKEQTDYNYNIKEFEFSSFEKYFNPINVDLCILHNCLVSLSNLCFKFISSIEFLFQFSKLFHLDCVYSFGLDIF